MTFKHKLPVRSHLKHKPSWQISRFRKETQEQEVSKIFLLFVIVAQINVKENKNTIQIGQNYSINAWTEQIITTKGGGVCLQL